MDLDDAELAGSTTSLEAPGSHSACILLACTCKENFWAGFVSQGQSFFQERVQSSLLDMDFGQGCHITGRRPGPRASPGGGHAAGSGDLRSGSGTTFTKLTARSWLPARNPQSQEAHRSLDKTKSFNTVLMNAA